MAIIGFIIFILVVIGVCSNPYGNGGGTHDHSNETE